MATSSGAGFSSGADTGRDGDEVAMCLVGLGSLTRYGDAFNQPVVDTNDMSHASMRASGSSLTLGKIGSKQDRKSHYDPDRQALIRAIIRGARNAKHGTADAARRLEPDELTLAAERGARNAQRTEHSLLSSADHASCYSTTQAPEQNTQCCVIS